MGEVAHQADREEIERQIHERLHDLDVLSKLRLKSKGRLSDDERAMLARYGYEGQNSTKSGVMDEWLKPKIRDINAQLGALGWTEPRSPKRRHHKKDGA
jgi:hypothetical protein